MTDATTKFTAKNTTFAVGEAEYDACEYNYQIVDGNDDIVALFPNEEDRDMVLKALLNASAA